MEQAAIVCFWCDTIGSLCLMNIVFFSKYLNSSINEHHVRQLKGLKQATREAQPTEENVKLQPGKPSWDVPGNLTTEKIKGTISHWRSIKGRSCDCSDARYALALQRCPLQDRYMLFRKDRCMLQRGEDRERCTALQKRCALEEIHTTKRCTLKYSI